jgi:putative PIN family toxin of toxin-antitoxin system
VLLRVVLDTNVVVSANVKLDGRQALILGLAFGGRFQLCVSEAMLAEYEEVLRRPRFKLDPERVSRAVAEIRRIALVVHPQKKLQVTRDPEDNMVLDCAVEAEADYLVTGNTRDFPARYRALRVVPPIAFMAILAVQMAGE